MVLVNSNPATIMTDPEMADAVYIEPINWQTVEKIIAKEKPDALLPTMGGQTALNCALDLADHGVLEKYNVELIGAKREAIRMAEDRELFRVAMGEIGLECRLPPSPTPWTKRWKSRPASAIRPSSAPASPWAAAVAALPTTAKSWSRSSAAAWNCRRPPKCWWKSRCWAGRNSRWWSRGTHHRLLDRKPGRAHR